MWTLVTMNGISAVLLLVVLGAVVALTQRWLRPLESGHDDGGLGDRRPRPLPRGPFDDLGFRGRRLRGRRESRLALSA